MDPEDPKSAAALPYSYTPLPAEDLETPPRSAVNRRPVKVLLVVYAGLMCAALIFTAMLGHHERVKRSSGDVRGNGVGFIPERLTPAVSRGVDSGVSEKTSRVSSGVGTPVYPWTNTMLSWQRTAFHFQPQKNWMNDPNGPMFYKGWYHFFYQYNPHGAVWGDIVWGHAVSKDLINWFHLPLAMVPDQWYDINGVWTGSATLLPDGKIIMLYTGSTDKFVQVQNLAYPANLSDPLLLEWVKFSGNPVLVPPPGIGAKDFRDPTTAWYTPDEKWRIAIGSKVNKTGITLLYDTTDFKIFELIDGVMHAVPKTGMWECVDFYPVSTVAENGLDTSVNGPEVKHVLKASMDDTRFDHYAIGTYNHSSGTWTPDDHELDVGYGLRYDYGKFYASKTFYDQNKQRRILWSWIGETDREYVDIMKGWSSVQGIPRTVVLDTKTGSNLLQWPIEEVDSLRSDEKALEKIELRPGSAVPLDVVEGTQMDIEAEFEISGIAMKELKATDEEYDCESSGGAAQRGALGPFGISVLADAGRTEHTPVYFYVTKGTDGRFKTSFCADQSRSSTAPDVDKMVHGSSVPVLDGEKYSMRILVDHSIVESFAQRGRTTITSRVYPTRTINGDTKVFLFNDATEATVLASLKVWHMRAAAMIEYPL